MESSYVYPHPSGKGVRFQLTLGILCIGPATLGSLAFWLGLLPTDPFVFVGDPNGPPTGYHLLGFDALGRDVLTRLCSAAANFFGPGALAVLVALSLGVATGVSATLGGRWGRYAAGWAIEVVEAVPKFVLVLLVASTTSSHLWWIMATVGLTFAPQIAETVRSGVIRLQKETFIEAEVCLGVGMLRIVFVHILWGHCSRILMGQTLSLLAYALLVESSLSYLGGSLGVQEPTPSWGNMIALARDGVFQGHVLPAALPAAAISVTLLGCSLTGHSLLDMVERRR